MKNNYLKKYVKNIHQYNRNTYFDEKCDYYTKFLNYDNENNEECIWIESNIVRHMLMKDLNGSNRRSIEGIFINIVY